VHYHVRRKGSQFSGRTGEIAVDVPDRTGQIGLVLAAVKNRDLVAQAIEAPRQKRSGKARAAQD
jgi:hypothetical protein